MKILGSRHNQILTSELTGWKPRLRNHCSSCNNISICTSKHPPLYVTGDSLSQVRFPTCQFYQSKFDVTRPCNFHKVLKTSVCPISWNCLGTVELRFVSFSRKGLETMFYLIWYRLVTLDFTGRILKSLPHLRLLSIPWPALQAGNEDVKVAQCTKFQLLKLGCPKILGCCPRKQ